MSDTDLNELKRIGIGGLLTSNERARVRLRRLLEEEHEQEIVHENIKRASVKNITINTMNYMLVPLSMPATLAAAGWVWGVLLFVLSTVWSYWSGLVIGEAFVANP